MTAVGCVASSRVAVFGLQTRTDSSVAWYRRRRLAQGRLNALDGVSVCWQLRE